MRSRRGEIGTARCTGSGSLTGWYWIELDGQELLHYSNDTLRRGAASWHGGHQLDLGYLSDPPWIQFWRAMSGDGDVLAVKWWHRPDTWSSPAGGWAR